MSGHCWDARDYSRNASAQQAWGRELIAKLDLTGDERVLDLGCGDGQLSARIAALVPRGAVLGLDVSPEMVDFARQSHPAASHPNLCFALGDAAALDQEAGFDRIFSNAALHWVRDHASLLAGVRRALAPGGRLVFQMGGRGNCREIFAARDEVMAAPAWREYFAGMAEAYCFPGDDEYALWLSAAGLTPTRVELIPRDMTHAGREGLAGWVRTTWLPYLERLPQARREAFIADLLDLYLTRHPLDQSGLSHVAMVRLEVEARV